MGFKGDFREWEHLEVVATATATEARSYAESRSFDLVISDIGLPDEKQSIT